MTAERARSVALASYLSCLVAAIALLFVKQFIQYDYPLVDNVMNIVGLYAVPLSIIVTAVASRRAPDAPVTSTALILLFGSTLIWNALILGMLAYYDWSSVYNTVKRSYMTDTIAAAFLASVPGKLTFLVSGALTYFFVGNTDKPVPQQNSADVKATPTPVNR